MSLNRSIIILCRSVCLYICMMILTVSFFSLYHRYINAHSPVVKHSDRKGHLGKSPRYDWDSYKSHAEMNAWIDSIAADNSWAEIVNIGQSEEGRDMNVLEIRKAGAGKPTIFIEAGELTGRNMSRKID